MPFRARIQQDLAVVLSTLGSQANADEQTLSMEQFDILRVKSRHKQWLPLGIGLDTLVDTNPVTERITYQNRVVMDNGVRVASAEWKTQFDELVSKAYIAQEWLAHYTN